MISNRGHVDQTTIRSRRPSGTPDCPTCSDEGTVDRRGGNVDICPTCATKAEHEYRMYPRRGQAGQAAAFLAKTVDPR